jgi:predicted alpha/beta superfamily hydrolase
VICNDDGHCPSNDCRTFPEAIVIGIANTGASRTCELTPTQADPNDSTAVQACAVCGVCGDADAYLKMLTTEIMQHAAVKALHRRTDVASTALVGSSLGGLVTAYAGLQYPQFFGLLGEMSPSTWWNNDFIVGKVMGTMPAPNRPLRVYVDSGLDPSAPPPVCYTPDDDQVDTDQLVAAYKSLGYVEGQNFHHVLQPMACHNETFWAQRFPGAMQFLLGVR